MSKQAFIIVVVLAAGLTLWLFKMGDRNQAIINDLSPKTAGSIIKIVAFGDSLTAGYGVGASESYPAQLETSLLELGYSVEMVNAGVNGETTAGNKERAATIRSEDPDIVLLGIGGNDALRRLPLLETEMNLRETLSILQSGTHPPVVVLLRMQAPLTSGLSYTRDFSALYETLAEEYKLVLLPFLTTELFLDPANKLQDGIHYNQEGYKQVVERYLLPELEKILDQLTR